MDGPGGQGGLAAKTGAGPDEPDFLLLTQMVLQLAQEESNSIAGAPE